MIEIAALGTAVPPYRYPQSVLRERAQQHFRGGIRDIDRLASVFDTVQVEHRHFCVPLDWFERDHTFSEKNEKYVHWAEELSVQAIEQCLGRAGLEPDQIDHVLFISSSGLATPSLDVRLINRLGLRPQVKRTPVFGLGCAGGAAGLSRCRDLLRGSEKLNVLLVVVEISSLTFQHQDFSKTNLVASALFADGAAALLVRSTDSRTEGRPLILDSQSTLWPKSTHLMGWDFSEKGFQVLLSRDLPSFVEAHIRENLENFLNRHGLKTDHLSHYIVHPGGAKVLLSMVKALQLNPALMARSHSVLARYGNMSSPTMLFILGEVLQDPGVRSGDVGLCAAFGPGFSSEFLLLQW